VCTLVILASTIIFAVKSSNAFAAVRGLLADLKVSAAAQGTVASATSGLLGCGLAVLVVVLVLAAIATLASMSGKARRYRVAHGGKRAFVLCFCLSRDWGLLCCVESRLLTPTPPHPSKTN
jgi:hypothetical protein